MAYVDPTPDGLMPAPLTLPRKVVRAVPARARVRETAPANTDADTERAEKIALVAIGILFASLVFTLAIVAIANLEIALVVTAITLLPLASLIVSPSGNGR